jgi:hypothetical protein
MAITGGYGTVHTGIHGIMQYTYTVGILTIPYYRIFIKMQHTQFSEIKVEVCPI